MALQKLFYQFEDLIKKIDTKIRNEDFKDLDIATQNINDLKTLLTSSSKSVNYIFYFNLISIYLSLMTLTENCITFQMINKENTFQK